MQSINSSKKSFAGKKVVFIALAALLVLAGALYYTETRHITSFIIKKPSAETMTQQQKEVATKSDPTTSPSTAKTDAQPAPGVSQSQTTTEVPVSKTMSVTITTLNETNNTVNITATITNPAQSGVCTMTFTKAGAKPVTQTVSTTTNTCSASIPALQFDMIGDWQVTVNYFANNTQATTTGTITIK